MLDPACGDGALLVAIASLANSRALDLVGFDLDLGALEAAATHLDAVGREGVHAELGVLDFLQDAVDRRQCGATLFASAIPDRPPFDVVIANPPYVRTQTLGADTARQMGTAFGLSGRVDLYHAFIVAMAENVAEGGTLALLCSNRFMTTRSGSAVRAYLQREFDIEHVFDLGDTKLFSAAVLPAVVFARRTTTRVMSRRMTTVYETDSPGEAPEAQSVLAALRAGADGIIKVGSRNYEIRRGDLTSDPLTKGTWALTSTSDDWLSRVDDATAMRFGDVGKVRVGIKTTADSVFIREDWSGLDPNQPEPELLLPLLTHHVASRWKASAHQRRVLYPYDLAAASRRTVNLENFPGAHGYLVSHRERLEGRRYVVEGGREWWEIWVPQRPSAWRGPKLVFPDIAETPKFFLDESGAVVNGDCYWMAMTPAEADSVGLLMMAVANSSLGSKYYDRVCGNKLYSGRRRYITQYVERFPIPDPGTALASTIMKLVRGLIRGTSSDPVSAVEKEIDSLVWSSFGVEEIPR